MGKLDRYIGGTVAFTIALAVCGLVGLISLFTFLEQIEDIDNNYTILGVAQFVLYSLPRMFYESIPFGALIGCIAGLGLLANTSELTVMRSAGVSTWSISIAAMKPALVLVFLGLFIGETILPDFERVARNDREKAKSEANEITPEFGFWYREGNVFMHFNEVDQDGVLTGVSHFYFDTTKERRLVKTLFAERAVFHDMGGRKNYWLMEAITITEFDDAGSHVSELVSKEWFTEITPELLSAEILVEPDKMSIQGLSRKIDYMREAGLNSGKFELGFWNKVLQPLATVGLVFVAISFVFGPLRVATMGMRVVTGLIIGVTFKFVQDFMSPASLVFGFSPVIATLVPILACFAVGFYLMRRAA